jgi:hypothetical protein
VCVCIGIFANGVGFLCIHRDGGKQGTDAVEQGILYKTKI